MSESRFITVLENGVFYFISNSDHSFWCKYPYVKIPIICFLISRGKKVEMTKLVGLYPFSVLAVFGNYLYKQSHKLSWNYTLMIV